MRSLSLILLLAGSFFGQSLQERIDKLDDSKSYVLKYDKFKDRTTLSTKAGFRIRHAVMDSVDMSVSASFPGEKLETINDFDVFFSPTFTRSWYFLNSHHLIFLVDGEKMDMGEGKQGGNVGNGGVNEYVYFKMTRENIESLANAKEVEIQLGPFEGKLNKKTTPRLINLLALTKK